MEALMETVSLRGDDLGKNFLDTHTGEAIYIPTEVCLALEDGTLEEHTFDNWLDEFVSLAVLISQDEINRYISTPIIDEDFYINAMKVYVNSTMDNSDLKLELNTALNSEEPIKNFKHILMDMDSELDKWYLYEDKCLDEYVKSWLKLNNIPF
jgi:hypothetical protein